MRVAGKGIRPILGRLCWAEMGHLLAGLAAQLISWAALSIRPSRRCPISASQDAPNIGLKSRPVALRQMTGGTGATAALEARGLVKLYGGREALKGVDLTVGAGELVEGIGPNGAGERTV